MPNTPATPEDRAVATLYEIFLAGEYAAVQRLIEESAMAPTTADRVNVMRMLGSEIDHFDVLAQQVSAVGEVVDRAVARHVGVFEKYHRVTTPSNWLEVLVKLYIGDAMVADFFAEVGQTMPEPARGVISGVMAHTVSSDWARDEVRAAVRADPAVAAPLALWGRRLLGEAITHMQWVLAEDDAVTDLLFAGTGSLTNAAAFFDTMAQRHSERMAAMGLA